MYRVEFRNAGEGMWRTGNLPVTLQAAQTIANYTDGRLADQTRIVTVAPAPRVLNLKI